MLTSRDCFKEEQAVLQEESAEPKLQPVRTQLLAAWPDMRTADGVVDAPWLNRDKIRGVLASMACWAIDAWTQVFGPAITPPDRPVTGIGGFKERGLSSPIGAMHETRFAVAALAERIEMDSCRTWQSPAWQAPAASAVMP